MELSFTKMQGAGNDYIYVNCLRKTLNNPEKLAVSLSDRRFGVGGDGLVLIGRSERADARMRMFNADGSEGAMCGNAIRCVGKYLFDKGFVTTQTMDIETASGVKTLTLFTDPHHGLVSSVRVDMGKAELRPSHIPVLLEGERIVNRSIPIGGRDYHITCVSMGNPHAVVFCERGTVDSLPLWELGPLFEHHSLFPRRVNTEFVELLCENRLKMRVWERGSGETLACGTGACAVVVAAVLNGHCQQDTDVTVELRGGDLTIRAQKDGTVLMTGPCETVFEGVAYVN